jgi:hypothetical protein
MNEHGLITAPLVRLKRLLRPRAPELSPAE